MVSKESAVIIHGFLEYHSDAAAGSSSFGLADPAPFFLETGVGTCKNPVVNVRFTVAREIGRGPM